MQTQIKESTFVNDLFWCFLAVFIIVAIAIPLFMFDITNTLTEFLTKMVILSIIACGAYKVLNYLSMEKS
jgi:uncharacterized protein YqhQ